MLSRPIVGKKAFTAFVQQMREAYPDLAYEVGQVGFMQLLGCSKFVGTCGGGGGPANRPVRSNTHAFFPSCASRC